MSRQASEESGPGELRAADVAEVTAQLRSILAGLAGDDLPLRAPVGTPLLRDGIGLDSLGGTMLLAEVQRRFGVDVAGEDLNLDSLATLRSLAEYVAARVMPG